MKSTLIDTGAIACLGIVNAVRPVRFTASARSVKGVSHKDCFLTRYQTADRQIDIKYQQGGGGRAEEEQGFTLISFIDSESVETWGTVLPVKWQRTMSRVGRLGREMATRRERMKAQKRRKMPGRKKARAAMMSMVSDQETREPWTSC
jgi:hypothetical protein